MNNIKTERLIQICKELIIYFGEQIDDDEQLYETLENAIGMSANEIDQLSGNFDDDEDDEDDRSEMPWDCGKHFDD